MIMQIRQDIQFMCQRDFFNYVTMRYPHKLALLFSEVNYKNFMRRLSENNALSSMKKFSDCIHTFTTERITFVHNHTCRLIHNICYH